MVEPQIQEEQWRFHSGRKKLDQLYTLSQMLEGSWEFTQPVHTFFVYLEKGFDYLLWQILCWVLQGQ